MIAIERGIISRWKIDTRFENFLSKKADYSEKWKILYCLYYRIFDAKYYKKGLPMIKRLVESKCCKNASKRVIRDMIYCLHRFGFSFDEYFSLELYNKNADGRDKFISDKMRYDYYCLMNTQEGIKLLRDKGKTYDILRDSFGRECVAIYSKNDIIKFESFVNAHKKFVYKPIALDCGKGIKIYEGQNITNELLFEEMISSGAFILEEVIVQSKKMQSLHPQSLNTVRVPTIRCSDGVHIFLPFFRMGRGDSIVDNAGAGGIFAAVDAESGVVSSKGVTEYGKGEYIFHPDTNKQILGFQLPDWEQAIELVKSLSNRIPSMKYIGWDIAHTERGWVVVEANGSGQFVSQIADKTGHREELMELLNKLEEV